MIDGNNGRWQLWFCWLAIFLNICIPIVVSQKDYERAALEAHNAFRRRHRNTPPMKLDADLNAKAQKCAEFYAAGNTPHTCPEAEEYGENIARGGLGNSEVAAVKRSVEAWYDEKKNYDFKQSGKQSGTGHFTQVVWAASRSLGCGVAKAGDDYYVPCLYAPAGNDWGKKEYQKNVQREK